MNQTILCGLIGIPPANGVIPQSPMHTKSLATLKHQVHLIIIIIQTRENVEIFIILNVHLKQLLRRKLVDTARKSINKSSNLSELYEDMQQAYNEMQTPLVYQNPSSLVNNLYQLQL